MQTTAIDRSAVEAMHNRAKELVLTNGLIGDAQSLRFAQGWLDVTSCLLRGKTAPLAAQLDASIGGYQPLAIFKAAWPALPDSAKNFTLAQMQEFLVAHGAEVSTKAVAYGQFHEVNALEDAKVSVVDGNDEMRAVAANLNNGSGLHAAASVVVDTPIVAQPPAPGQHWPAQGGTYIGIASAEGDLPARHLVALDIEPQKEQMNWADAVKWAQSLGNGARLCTHLEGVHAYTTAKQAFETSGYYWTGTQDSRLSAFVQGFEGGYSYWSLKGNEHRVRAFRGLALQTFTPLIAVAAGDSAENFSAQVDA